MKCQDTDRGFRNREKVYYNNIVMEYKNIIMKYNNMLMFQCNDLKELKSFSCFSIAVATLGMSPSNMGKF